MRLIDADELRKYFEVPHELKCGIQAGMDEYALKCIDEQPTVAASPWHRVEEPPKEYGNYLAVVNGEVMEVTYSDISVRDDWKWSTCDAEGFVWIRSESVTHWMPLPEPPKEDE